MDKFLFSKVGGSANNPVPLSIIHSFKRMRHFQPFSAVVAALKDSSFLELTDEDTAVRRREPLPLPSLSAGDVDDNGEAVVKVFEDRAIPRSIYAKGFGEEVPSTQFDIEAFFAEFGPTNAIRLRRSDTKNFKGSVFVEFASEELQQKFLALDPKPKYKGRELNIMSKKVYCDGKVADIKSGRIKPNNRSFRDNRGKRKRDDEDDRDWRERRDEDRRHEFRDRRGGGRRRGSPDYNRGGRHRDGEKSKDQATRDALAQAREVVEKESKTAEADKREAIDEGKAEANAEAKPEAGSKGAPTAATNGTATGDTATEKGVATKKRARDENAEAAAPAAKKVDTKTELST
jgi:lupus La protein